MKGNKGKEKERVQESEVEVKSEATEVSPTSTHDEFPPIVSSTSDSPFLTSWRIYDTSVTRAPPKVFPSPSNLATQRFPTPEGTENYIPPDPGMTGTKEEMTQEKEEDRETLCERGCLGQCECTFL